MKVFAICLTITVDGDRDLDSVFEVQNFRRQGLRLGLTVATNTLKTINI